MQARPIDPEVQEWTAQLMWQACRWQIDPPGVQAALAHGADAPAAAVAAVDQRIAPLLWRALDVAGALDSLAEARSGLRAIAEVGQMEALLLLPQAVATAVRPLTDAGLEPVVLKGPALAVRYPEPGLRPMDDIDLLLPREQHDRALELLDRAGWKVVRAARRDLYDTVLVHHEIPSLSLELHYGLEATYQRVTSLEARDLWDRRRPIDCLGTAAFGLPLPEEIVSLAVHASKPLHSFCRLVWIADLAMIIGHHTQSGGEVEWDRVRSIAEAGRCSTVVGAALALAQHAGVASPADLLPLPERGRRGSALRQLLAPSWPLNQAGLSDFKLHYGLTDGAWRRARTMVFLLGHDTDVGRWVRSTIAAPGDVLERRRESRVPVVGGGPA